MALRGCSRDANDDYSRVCTATRSDCIFLCISIRQVARLVKQGNSSQKVVSSTVPLIQILVLHSQLGISFRAQFIDISFNGQAHPARDRLRRLGIEHHAIEKPFRNVKKLCHLFSRLHFLSRHKSKGRNLVLRPLSDFINQLEVHLSSLRSWIPLGTLASPVSKFATSCTPRAKFQLLNARALHARSLISATCTSSGAEEISGLLRNIEILSDGPVPRVSESWSSLQ